VKGDRKLDLWRKERLKELIGERIGWYFALGSLLTQIPFWIHLNKTYAYGSAIFLCVHVIIKLIFNYKNEKIYIEK
jgi:hypothetical protein